MTEKPGVESMQSSQSSQNELELAWSQTISDLGDELKRKRPGTRGKGDHHIARRLNLNTNTVRDWRKKASVPKDVRPLIRLIRSTLGAGRATSAEVVAKELQQRRKAHQNSGAALARRQAGAESKGSVIPPKSGIDPREEAKSIVRTYLVGGDATPLDNLFLEQLQLGSAITDGVPPYVERTADDRIRSGIQMAWDNQRSVENPFSKCFFVVGPSKAGKTRIILEQLNNTWKAAAAAKPQTVTPVLLRPLPSKIDDLAFALHRGTQDLIGPGTRFVLLDDIHFTINTISIETIRRMVTGIDDVVVLGTMWASGFKSDWADAGLVGGIIGASETIDAKLDDEEFDRAVGLFRHIEVAPDDLRDLASTLASKDALVRSLHEGLNSPDDAIRSLIRVICSLAACEPGGSFLISVENLFRQTYLIERPTVPSVPQGEFERALNWATKPISPRTNYAVVTSPEPEVVRAGDVIYAEAVDCADLHQFHRDTAVFLSPEQRAGVAANLFMAEHDEIALKFADDVLPFALDGLTDTLGLGYKYNNRIDEARAWFQCGLDAGLIECARELANLEAQFGDPAEAKNLWRNAAGLGDVDSMVELAVANIKTRTNLDEARTLLEQAAQKGDPYAKNNLAMFLIEMEPSNPAGLKMTIELAQEDGPAALLHLASIDHDGRGEEYLDRAVAKNFPEAIVHRARQLVAGGLQPEAIELLKRKAGFGSEIVLWELGTLLVADDYDVAFEHFVAAAKADRATYGRQLLPIVLLSSSPSEAMQVGTDLIGYRTAEAQLIVGNVLLEAERFEESRDFLLEAAQAGLEEAWWLTSHAERGLGNEESATEYLQTAVRLRDPRAVIELAQSLRESGNEIAAIEQFEIAAELGHPFAWTELAWHELGAGNAETGLDLFEVGARGCDPEALFMVGVFAGDAGDNAAQRDYWLRAFNEQENFGYQIGEVLTEDRDRTDLADRWNSWVEELLEGMRRHEQGSK